MAERPERILALDIDLETVRGIVLAGGSQAVAGGYAQLAFGDEGEAAAVASRIAAALDVKATLPVVISCDESLGSVSEEVVEAVRASGFSSITQVSRSESMRRANPGGVDTDKLVDTDIAAGLLTSHAGLTLNDLAPVVGAGLGVLGLGAPVIIDDPEPEPVAVWQPETPPETTTVGDDPFTSTPVVAGAAAAAAGAALVSNAADAAEFDDDATHTRPAAEPEVVDPFELDDVTVPPEVDAQSAADSMLAEDDATMPPTQSDAVAEPVADRALDRAPEPTPETEPPSEAAVAATAQTAARSTPIHSDDEDSNSKKGLLFALALGVIAMAIGAFFVFGGGNDEVASRTQTATVEPPAAAESAATEPAATESAPAPTAEPAETVVEPTAVPAPEPTAVPTAEPTVDAEPEPEAEPEPTADPLQGLPPLSTLPERGAIFRPPTLYLEGPVQTQEQADELYERAVAVVGPDNVVNDYVVRPDAPASTDGNVRVEQAVLFGTGSAAISDEFVPTLELGVAVMTLNPQVQMVVEGHTDSVGGEVGNQALSERRAQAVVDYLASRGVEPDRLEAVGFGESAPVASNDDAQGRQINRRIEVNLLDLLAGE